MIWITIIAEFALALALLWGGIKLAPKIGLTDQPGGRKHHEGAVPLIGGLVVIPVFVLGLIIVGYASQLWPLLAGVLVLLVMGALDDRFHVSAWIKLIVQIWVACFVVVFSQAQLFNLGNLLGFGDIVLGNFVGTAFAVICLALMMNAVNMMDGLDGLAGGFSAVVLFWLMLACALASSSNPLIAMACLLAPLLAFLAFNMHTPWRKKAAVFLGDAGSLSLGMILGWFCITLSQGLNTILPPMSAAWIIALPIMDALALFMARLAKGRHPFDPDRNHFHHHFVDNGMPPEKAVPIILALGFGFGLIGMLGLVLSLPAALLFAAWVGLYALHLSMALRPSMWISILK